MIELANRSYRAARAALEVLGQATPDRLERELNAQLVIALDDLSELSVPANVRAELGTVNTGGVAAQFTQLHIFGQNGVRVHDLFNNTGTAVLVGMTDVGSLPALAGGAPSIARNPRDGTLAQVLSGASAVLPAGGWTLVPAQVSPLRSRPFFVPSGKALFVVQATANTAIGVLYYISEPVQGPQ